MKKFRFADIHFIMIGLIIFGCLALLIGMRPVDTVLIFSIFFVSAIFVGLLIYQNHSFEIEEFDTIRYVNEQAENSLSTLLEGMPVGVIKIHTKTNEVEWFNPFAELMFSKEDGGLDEEKLDKILRAGLSSESSQVTVGNQHYTVHADFKNQLFYFFDVSSVYHSQNIDEKRKPVIGIISVDNYDDLEDNLSEIDLSQINTFLANFIGQFAESYQIFSRRVSMDRFYIFTDYGVLKQLMSEKFPVLQQFKDEAKSKELPLTLSFGIAYGDQEHYKIGQVALKNLNMAEIRGGDQVVVKEADERQNPIFFGGNTASSVKRTRTRTRAMMTAISDKLKTVDKVFVVGHKRLDMDALGAAVGMQHFSSNIIDNSYTVFDEYEMSQDIERAINLLKSENLGNLITVDEALKTPITDQSLLIMVDHSKTSLTLSYEFYEKFSQVIVVDHHRRDTDFPENAVITYIESGASSAAELVTELIQFQDDRKNRLSKLQASLLMAGIMLDTKNFSSRVTSRTFDVASYLRRRGSDSLAIQTISATDFDEYKAINEIILRGRRVLPNVIIAQADSTKLYDNVVTSKAADTILQMAGIEASFVLTQNTKGFIAISARSRGKINVQRIMEEMGGGGHFNLAACQIKGVSIEEAYQSLHEQVILQMTNKDN